MPYRSRQLENDGEVNWKKIAIVGVITFILSLLIGRWFGSKLLESRSALKEPPPVAGYAGPPPIDQNSNLQPQRQNIASPPLVVPPPVVEPTTPAPVEKNIAPPVSSYDESIEPDTAPTVTEKPSPAGPKTTPYKGTKAFKVQAGLFSSTDNAKDLVNHLRDEGYKSDFEMINRPDGNFYRVWVGPFDTHDAAESAAGELNGAGYQAFVLSTK